MATSETGPPGAGRAERPLGEGWVYSVVANDPHGELVDRTGVGEGELAQIDELMAALAGLRAAEQELTRASLTYMQLNETDMKALHYLIVCEQQGVVATPSTIAAHLGISSASTTKLLDRLEKGGHVRRSRHPSDRRDRKSTRLNSSHVAISYAVFCLKKKIHTLASDSLVQYSV